MTPKKKGNSLHLWCFLSEIKDNSKVSIDDLKPIADSLSKKLDVPFSVYIDERNVSLATFWDNRFLGASRFFGS